MVEGLLGPLVLLKLLLVVGVLAMSEVAWSEATLVRAQLVVDEGVVVGIGVVVELVNDVLVEAELVLLVLRLPPFLVFTFRTIQLHGHQAVAARLMRVAFPLDVVLESQLGQRALAHF